MMGGITCPNYGFSWFSMADSSLNKSCIHCKDSSSDPLMNGWKFHTSEYAQLCHSCYSIYKAGKFCITFHVNEDGWRDCNSCGKLFHCGCIVSLADYSMHDFGGIICNDCSRTNFVSAPQCLKSESNPQDLEKQSIPIAPESSEVTFLFDKKITPSDANNNNSRIIIRKKHATAFFPELSVGQVYPLNLLDTDGKDWDFNYRYWVHGDRRMHALQGLKRYMVSKNLQAGDTVAFYQRKSDGKMVIELKKTSNSSGLNLTGKVACLRPRMRAA